MDRLVSLFRCGGAAPPPAAGPAREGPHGDRSFRQRGLDGSALYDRGRGTGLEEAGVFSALSSMTTWMSPWPPATAPLGAAARHWPQPVQRPGAMYTWQKGAHTRAAQHPRVMCSRHSFQWLSSDWSTSPAAVVENWQSPAVTMAVHSSCKSSRSSTLPLHHPAELAQAVPGRRSPCRRSPSRLSGRW